MHARRLRITLVLAVLGGAAVGGAQSAVDAPDGEPLRFVRWLETSEELDLPPGLGGLAFPPATRSLLVEGPFGRFDAWLVCFAKAAPLRPIAGLAVPDPITLTATTTAAAATLVVAYDRTTRQLAALRMWTAPDGSVAQASEAWDARAIGAADVRGLALDGKGERLFVLDAASRTVHRLRLDDAAARSAGAAPRPEAVWAVPADVGAVHGLAFDARSGHLHVASGSHGTLTEFTTAGHRLGTRALPAAARPVRALVFAPTGDRTDLPDRTGLFIIAGGVRPKVGEWSLEPFVAPEAGTQTATLVRTTSTAGFSPPSPDPAGVAFDDSTGRLLISDSEVNETWRFVGVNFFETTPAGSLRRTSATIGYTREPTGVARNPSTRMMYVTDDDWDEVYMIDPGADGAYHTADDVVTSFDTRAFGSTDPEGITFATTTGELFIVDGVNTEVYRVNPGRNGRFDGVPPAGDDVVTSFDTFSLGIDDPEGIAFDHDNNLLYVVGRPRRNLAHVTLDGSLVRLIDIGGAPSIRPAGLAYAPASATGGNHLYVVDRGVDNDTEPNENDGQLFEFALPPLSPGNLPPMVSAGPDRTVMLPAAAELDGTVVDDGLPDPPAAVITTWSRVSGPGTVAFADPGAVDTTATFSLAGTYELRLTADDGELQSSDVMVVVVQPSGGAGRINIRVARSEDDAEETESTSVVVTSTDLEMVFDRNNDQLVGMRFANVAIPRGATIRRATIQFQADESTSVATDLVLRGEAADDAAAFAKLRANISSRRSTTAAVRWSPPPWTRGQAGAAQLTPDLAPVVQEIVDRSAWTAGNAMVILVSGTGERVAESFDGAPLAAPLLQVEFDR